MQAAKYRTKTFNVSRKNWNQAVVSNHVNQKFKRTKYYGQRSAFSYQKIHTGSLFFYYGDEGKEVFSHKYFTLLTSGYLYQNPNQGVELG